MCHIKPRESNTSLIYFQTHKSCNFNATTFGDELTNWIFDLATSWPAVLGDEMTRATSWPVIYFKGGSRVFGKGGTKKIEVTVHVMAPSTGRRPVDAMPWASPGGGFEGGVPPPELEKNWNKEDFRRNLVTHGSQIYWIELQFCCLLNSQVGIIQVGMFLSTSRSYQFTSFTLPISTCTRCQV